MAYSPNDCANAQLPESGGTCSTLDDSGLYSFDDELELKGINEDLDEVSDSSSEDDDMSDGEGWPDPIASPPRKRQCVSGKARKARGRKVPPVMRRIRRTRRILRYAMMGWMDT